MFPYLRLLVYDHKERLLSNKWVCSFTCENLRSVCGRWNRDVSKMKVCFLNWGFYLMKPVRGDQDASVSLWALGSSVYTVREAWWSVKLELCQTHTFKPQSICAAGAVLVCQSNIALNPKIACIWLQAPCLSHVYVNTCERLHLSSRSVSTPEEFREMICPMQFGYDGRDTKSELFKATHLKISPQKGLMKCITTQLLTDSIGLPDECENKLRKLALFYYLWLQ